MSKLLYEGLTYKIRGSLYKVAKELGVGLPERTYQRATCRVFDDDGVPYETEKSYSVIFRGEQIDVFRVDLVVDNKVIVELKAVEKLLPIHKAQLITYLRVSGLRVGLLVNFGVQPIGIVRVVV